MRLSAKATKEFQELYKNKYGEDLSWEEAQDAGGRLVGLVKILYDIYIEDKKRQHKLKEHPKGFALENGMYSCAICKSCDPDNTAWYDKWGIKCFICQAAIDKKIIPGSIAKNDDLWYSKFDLETRFGIKHHTIKRFIKEGVLKARIVPHSSRRPY